MVKIIDFKTIESENKEPFNMLVVQGGVEPVISKETGRIYLTIRKANVTTTFDADLCKSLIGTELPGTVRKVPCEPYDYTVKETGETVSLNYNWQYIDEDLLNANKQLIDEELVN